MPSRGTTALFTLLIKIGQRFLFDASVSTNGSGCLFQQTFVGKERDEALRTFAKSRVSSDMVVQRNRKIGNSGLRK